jgi:site-specific recombinase XerD
MKVNIYLKNEPDTSGRHLIFIYVSKDGKRIKISTGIKIPKASWTGKGIKPSKILPEKNAEKTSKLLQAKISLLEKIRADFDMSFQDFTLEELKEKYLNYGKDTPGEITVQNCTLFGALVDQYKEKYRNMRKPKTLGRFNQVVTALNEYSPGITIEQIDYNFLIGYCDFLIKKGFVNNTIKHNHIKAIKIIGKEAVRMGIKVNSDIDQFTWKSMNVKPFAATWEEVKKIEAIREGLTKAQEHIRDIFIISCYTGLRDSDLRLINKSNMSTQKGRKVLRVVMEKTDFDYYIPLAGKVMEILDRYSYGLPIYSQQHHNRELKNIAGLVIKNEQYQKVTVQGNKKTYSLVARKDMFSTHTGRRTFGRRFLDMGGNIVILSKIFGHSSIEVTLKYIGYEAQEIMNEFFRVMGDD